MIFTLVAYRDRAGWPALLPHTNVYFCAMQECYMGDLCDNIIGLVLACLVHATASLSQYKIIMSQPSGIHILSPVLFMHVGDPYTF